MKVNPLVALLDKALKALPAKSPARVEIEAALEKRKEATARAQAAWVTMRSEGGVHYKAPEPSKGKGKAKAPAKTGPAPKTSKPAVKAPKASAPQAQA
jgi:hypothetical protein